MKIQNILVTSLVFATIFVSLPAVAAGGGDYSSTASKSAAYNEALALIKAENYLNAITKLNKAKQSAKDDADIQNLLGFSYRKLGNLDEAATHYNKALDLDPKHKGALEYQGELFLMLGDKAAAEDNLEKLDKICWLGCDELDELRAAIEKFSP
jgi:Flp pilus assembly protein TadD